MNSDFDGSSKKTPTLPTLIEVKMKRGGVYLELELPTLREELKEEYQCYVCTWCRIEGEQKTKKDENLRTSCLKLIPQLQSRQDLFVL